MFPVDSCFDASVHAVEALQFQNRAESVNDYAFPWFPLAERPLEFEAVLPEKTSLARLGSIIEPADVFSSVGKEVASMTMPPSFMVFSDVVVPLVRTSAVSERTRAVTDSFLEVADIDMTFAIGLFPSALTFPVMELSPVI